MPRLRRLLSYSRSGYDFLMFSRPDMHHLLLAQVPPEKVLMKKRVLSIEQNEHGVMVRVADGSTYHGDILVGADGAYSGVRQGLFKLMEKKGELPESDKSSLKLGYISMVGVSHPQDPEKYPVLKEPSSNFSRVIGDGTPHSVCHTGSKRYDTCSGCHDRALDLLFCFLVHSTTLSPSLATGSAGA